MQLFNDAVISNPDERRGIPVPFQVFDDEGDQVEVIFQWRREGEEFPELAESEIDAVLAGLLLVNSIVDYRYVSRLLTVQQVRRGLDEVVVAAVEQERLEGWIMGRVEAGQALPGLYPPDETQRAAYEAWARSRR